MNRPRHSAAVRRVWVVLCLAAVMLAGSACGGDDAGEPAGGEAGAELREATLILDFVAGPAHLGIFTALERGLYAEQGIDLEVVEPSSTADTLRLIEAGRAEFGIADGIDVANQIEAGRGAKAVMAVAQRPLGGLITRRGDGFDSPADLEGATVGVTGVASDDVLIDTELREAGADPDSVERVTIGFAGVRALQTGNVDAFTGFIPADAVQVDLGGMPTRSFAFDEWGGPQYPGLVVFSTETRIAEDADLIGDFVAATVRGYEAALDDPAAALDDLIAANPGIEREFAEASSAAILPFFTVEGVPFGQIRPEKISELSDFLVEEGLAAAPITPDRYATDRFLP